MTYGPYKEILAEVKDNILTLTLHRPEKLNAFTGTMMNEMIEVFGKASADDDVRVIILTGSGRAFCAGADLSQGAATFDYNKRTDRPDRQAGSGEAIDWSDERIRDGGGRVTLAMFECLKPIICAVNGPAVGVGVTMQLAADIRIASDQAKFGFVFSKRGIVPEACSSWFLPRIVGISQALEWSYTGRIFDAEEALRGRLISGIYKHDQLMPHAHKLAAEIRDNAAPVSTALIRQMMWRLSALDHPMEAHKVDSRGIYSRGSSADVKEGVMSFLEKRPAKFPQAVSTDMPPFFPWWEDRKYS
ncbi:MAG TPA: crotonase/enoyl-CoA hydratase family protein [Rhizomicrobium sp.]|jgi:enoyl-CoA hydratase/carnithine racemase|nr:crotonase/enoyl-CoA hydratase family protein [Rhizomicrobium sp.]